MSKTPRKNKDGVENSYTRFAYAFEIPDVKRAVYAKGYKPQASDYWNEKKHLEEEAERLGKATKAMIGDCRGAIGVWAESLATADIANGTADAITATDESGWKITAPLVEAVKRTAESLITAFAKGNPYEKLYTAKNGASSKEASGTAGNWQVIATVKALVTDKDSDNEQGRIKRSMGMLYSSVEAVLSENDDKLQTLVVEFCRLTKLSTDFFAQLVQCGINGNRAQLARAYKEAAIVDAGKASQEKLAAENNAKKEIELNQLAERLEVDKERRTPRTKEEKESAKQSLESDEAAERIKAETIKRQTARTHSSPLQAVNATMSA